MNLVKISVVDTWPIFHVLCRGFGLVFIFFSIVNIAVGSCKRLYNYRFTYYSLSYSVRISVRSSYVFLCLFSKNLKRFSASQGKHNTGYILILKATGFLSLLAFPGPCGQ